jgi:methionine biosynthesis protein MetW
MSIDTPSRNDNRAYNWTGHGPTDRAEYPVILRWVPMGSHVLDMGCGDGSLMARLIAERQVTGLGIEITDTGVAAARARGVTARQGRIDVVQDDLAPDSFDVAICNVTLMMVMYPEVLLREMRRLAPVSIVSFSNFAVIHNRLDMLLWGRVPRPMLFGYRWWETGQIHPLSVTDFRELTSDVGLSIVDAEHRRSRNPVLDFVYRTFPNVFTSVPIFKLHRAQPSNTVQ